MKTVLALALLAAATLARADPWEAFFTPFLGDLRAELADAQHAGLKGAVIMYEFEQCPYCARMKSEGLSRPDVQRAYQRQFVALQIDTRGALPITGFDGRTLPERDYARAAGVRATPTFDFVAADGTLLYRHVGGLYDPAEFVLLGHYVASGAYRSRTFADYKLSRPRGS
ncbi:MAG TPA: thioredoxin fold domain-containing protein [Burkholderiaceae bacterium]|nr:thioredoxin fold domain-containing protein [Burkholderiaceae bacterium]